MTENEEKTFSVATYESLLEKCGGFGRYQGFMYLWFQITCFFSAFNMIFMVFGGLSPSCPAESNSSEFADQNCTEFFHSIVMEFSLFDSQKYLAKLITSLQMVGVLLGKWSVRDLWSRTCPKGYAGRGGGTGARPPPPLPKYLGQNFLIKPFAEY